MEQKSNEARRIDSKRKFEHEAGLSSDASKWFSRKKLQKQPEQSTYPYKRLTFSEDHQYIRILILHGTSDPGAGIECDLVDECLCQCSETYEALSYTWGTEDASRRISIGGYEHYIRPNLFDALKRLRPLNVFDLKSSRRLWIDALCIDQWDPRERSRQITLMRSIYGCAERVLAWLGEDCQEKSAARVLDFIRWQERTKSHLEQRDAGQLFFNYNNLSSNHLRPAAADLAVDHFLQFFDKQWFRRRWIVQEITMAKQVIVLCGDAMMRWKAIQLYALPVLRKLIFPVIINSALALLTMPQSKGFVHDKICRTLETSSAMSAHRMQRNFVWKYFNSDDARFRSSSEGAYTAIAIMDQFHDLECADDRDRIGALSGLQRGLHFRIDYAATVADNFVAFAAAIAENGCAMELMLSAAHRTRDCKAPRILPSWVPDWRRPLSTPTAFHPQLRRTQELCAYVDGALLVIPRSRVRPISEDELAYVDYVDYTTSTEGQFNGNGLRPREDFLCIPYHFAMGDEGEPSPGSLILHRQRNTAPTYEVILSFPLQAENSHGIFAPLVMDKLSEVQGERERDDEIRQPSFLEHGQYIYID